LPHGGAALMCRWLYDWKWPLQPELYSEVSSPAWSAMERYISCLPQLSFFHKHYRPRNWSAGLAGSGFAGLISGLLGVGGGFIKVPIMYTLMDIPLGVATATSNFMVGITAAASVFIYYGRGDVHPLVVIPTALGVFIGAMLGVYVLPRLRVAWVRMGLIGLLFVMGLYMLWQGWHQVIG
jgi:uncharacterized membrane protein YfcA